MAEYTRKSHWWVIISGELYEEEHSWMLSRSDGAPMFFRTKLAAKTYLHNANIVAKTKIVKTKIVAKTKIVKTKVSTVKGGTK